MFSSEAKEIVKKRIEFVKELMKFDDQFKTPKILKTSIPSQIFYPYEDYQGLLIYLLLTCFDIMGQPEGWLSFGDCCVQRERLRRGMK